MGIWDRVKKAAKKTWNSVKSTAKNAWDKGKRFASKASKAAYSLGAKLPENGLLGKVRSGLQAPEQIKGVVNKYLGKGKELYESRKRDIKSKVGDIGQQAKQKYMDADRLFSKEKKRLRGGVAAEVHKGKQVMEQARSAANTTWNKMRAHGKRFSPAAGLSHPLTNGSPLGPQLN